MQKQDGGEQNGGASDPSSLTTTQSPFEILDGRRDHGLILICDHATNHVPPQYGNLGLDAARFERHIAYDVGAAGVTRTLALLLDVPAVLTRFSRLIIDPNRGVDDPTLIMRLSDGTVVPGNLNVSAEDRANRIANFYEPYHCAITDLIENMLARDVMPHLLSIHSFTESWKGVPRPWHAAVLWDEDRRFAGPLIAALRADGELAVGDNEPYSGRLPGDTMWRHGTRRAIPHALLEIRQDLIREEKSQVAWAQKLAGIFQARTPGQFPAYKFDNVASEING